jgi:hypothetical protein
LCVNLSVAAIVDLLLIFDARLSAFASCSTLNPRSALAVR